MFDFLGTFKLSAWEALRAFADAHLGVGVQERLASLTTQIQGLGWVTYLSSPDNQVIGYRVDPPQSKLDRLFKQYAFMGGDPLSLNLISRGDWIYLTKGALTLGDEPFTGGFPSKGDYRTSEHLADLPVAITVSKIKAPLLPSIQRLERVEHEIRRTVDRADQLLEEGILLVQRTTGVETVQELLEEMDFYIANPSQYPSISEG